MIYRESRPFSSGSEYVAFLYNWCEWCTHYKLRDDWSPESPENGGCPVLDAMFNSEEFPKKDIVEELYDDRDVVSRRICKRFEPI